MKKDKLSIIKSDIEKIENKFNQNKENSCLIIKETNQWIEEAKSRPIPNMLFSEFWYENEVCILFADTNLGKSILAMQIADSISKGLPIKQFKLESGAKKVLYLDFELSDKQLEKRCSNNYTDHYEFDKNFLRGELNTAIELPKGKSIEDLLCSSLIEIIDEVKPKVLIVDNITFLSHENEKAKDALSLMKTLKKLSTEMSISILVLSHTPKRCNSKPLSKDDLSGSKMLMNFCDSSFAIGASSTDSSLRYIKQIKQRNTEHIYDSQNVIVCTIEKENNFLGFRFIDYEPEANHIKQYNNLDIDQRDEQMKELIDAGLSNVAIAEQLALSEGAIRKRRKKLGV